MEHRYGYFGWQKKAGIPYSRQTFWPVDTSNKMVGARGVYLFHFLFADIKYRGSMSSCTTEKSDYRLHAENRRSFSLPDETNAVGAARAETRIPNEKTIWLEH